MKSIERERIEKWAGMKIISTKKISATVDAEVFFILLANQTQIVVKTSLRNPATLKAEYKGIRALAMGIKTPKQYLIAPHILISEYIPSALPKKGFYEKFGRDFAELHKAAAGYYGFEEDNFIGVTPQLNPIKKVEEISWVEYYLEYRLRYQMLLAEKKGYASSTLKQAFSQIETRINQIIPHEHIQPSLLHGDLWSGNYICNEKNEAVLIDPAVYWGHREADLAMTKLFGGFSTAFYNAYNEAFPLEPGATEREDIYKLYHVLNHLNIFGSSYYAQALSLMQRYL